MNYWITKFNLLFLFINRVFWVISINLLRNIAKIFCLIFIMQYYSFAGILSNNRRVLGKCFLMTLLTLSKMTKKWEKIHLFILFKKPCILNHLRISLKLAHDYFVTSFFECGLIKQISSSTSCLKSKKLSKMS